MDKPVVLLVDDEPAILSALRRALRHQGYELLPAASAREALEILASEEVSIVVCDYRMPEMNGEELLEIVRTTYPRVRRLMLTGFSSLSSVEELTARGVAEKLLMKPWEEEVLCHTIEELLHANREGEYNQ